MEQSLGPLTVVPKIGDEHIHRAGRPLNFTLLDFWRWSSSDLASNALRGVFAEYLVACALGGPDSVRTEWDAYDLQTMDGRKIEVKSAAYLQSWHQVKPSAIGFGIQPTRGWDARNNTVGTVLRRQADIYVFALLHHQDKATLDPLDVTQWMFYVLPVAVLDERHPMQRRLALSALRALQPAVATFETLSAVVAAVPVPLAPVLPPEGTP